MIHLGLDRRWWWKWWWWLWLSRSDTPFVRFVLVLVVLVIVIVLPPPSSLICPHHPQFQFVCKNAKMFHSLSCLPLEVANFS